LFITLTMSVGLQSRLSHSIVLNMLYSQASLQENP